MSQKAIELIQGAIVELEDLIECHVEAIGDAQHKIEQLQDEAVCRKEELAETESAVNVLHSTLKKLKGEPA